MRTQLMESACPIIEAMAKEIIGIKVLTMHHDISTKTGEEVILFTLAESPVLREPKRNAFLVQQVTFRVPVTARASEVST